MNKRDLSVCGLVFLVTIGIIYLPTATFQNVATAILVLALLAIPYFNLELGFIVALFYLPISLRLNLSGTSDALSFDTIFLLFDNLALITIWRLLRRKENPLKGWSRPMLAATFIFLLALVLPLAVSVDKGLTIRRLWNVGQYYIGFAVMIALWREFAMPLLKRSAWALLISGGLLSLYSLALFYAQWIVGDAWSMRNWLFDHTVEIQHGIRTYQTFVQGDNNWILINGPLRAVGTFPTPMGLGQYIFISLVLAIAFIIFAPRSVRFFANKTQSVETVNGTSNSFKTIGVSNRTEYVICYVVLVLGIITEVATYSRGAWLGAVLALAVVLGLVWLGNGSLLENLSQKLKSNFGKVLIPGLVVIVVVVAITVFQNLLPLPYPANYQQVVKGNYSADQTAINNRLLESLNADNESNQVRFTVWKKAISLFESRPVLGYGLGTSPVDFGDLVLSSENHTPTDALHSSLYAHNIYLDFMVETGIIGLLAYLFIIGLSVYYAWQLWKRPEQDWQIIGLMVLAVTAGMALHNIFDDMFLVPKNGLSIFMLIALVFVGKLMLAPQTVTAPAPSPQVAVTNHA